MDQILINKGKISCEEVPAPEILADFILVKVIYSCISTGTELAGLSKGRSGLIKKALKQPEKVKQVFNMYKNVGFSKTLKKVKSEIDTAKPLGYSAAGIIQGFGRNINGFKIGDRVAVAGAGFANHAQFVNIPENLVTKIPENVEFKEASTVALGAIAMQGVRRADLRLGETAVVFGLGLIGQITVQLLKISGCKVVGIDIDDRRIKIAKQNGADLAINPHKKDVVNEIQIFTEMNGADAVVFTAATTSSEPLSTAFQLCKKRGRVVLVGVSGMEMKRKDMYKKELDFLISTSYGPGRYDDNFELKGLDYPYAYVRWTESRNMQEYLYLMSTGQLKLASLIEKTFSVTDAEKAYESLKMKNPPLGVLLSYEKSRVKDKNRKAGCTRVNLRTLSKSNDILKLAVVGVGGFAKAMHLPNLEKLKANCSIYAVADIVGTNAKAVAKQYGAKYATTDYKTVVQDKQVDVIMICTRHDLHASLAIEALKSNKAVFVEKPMATTWKDLKNLEKLLVKSRVPYMVGFNRRFSPFAQEVKNHLIERQNPLVINYRMNAGFIPLTHWVHNEGGGRIIGEGCHIIDLFNFFTESEIESISVDSLDPKKKNVLAHDNVIASIKYKDGSIASLSYIAVGSKDFPKESMEIYYDGKTIHLSDYKLLQFFGIKSNLIRNKVPDKGHLHELRAFFDFVQGRQDLPPIALWDMVQTTQATLLIEESIRGNGNPGEVLDKK